MSKQKKQLFQDAVFLIIGISFALIVLKFGLAERLVFFLNDFQWLGIIFAGMLFTSVFTTATSIVLLATFAQTTSPLILAVFGGFGAMIGDYIIFRFVKDRISEDFKYLFSFSKRQRILAIFKTHLFKFFVPFIGALIIASPLPDEIGIVMLGMSKVNNRLFLSISYVMNGTGILIISLIARSILF